MASIDIERIEIAVHLSYSRHITSMEGLHPHQVELSNGWDNHVLGNIASDKRAILIYVPWLCFPESSFVPNKRLLIPEKSAVLVEKDEARRVFQYSQALGDRFLYCRQIGLPDVNQIEVTLSKRDFSFDPRSTEVFPFGELLDVCVDTIGDHIREQLQIPRSNYYRPTPYLSLSSEYLNVIKAVQALSAIN